MRYLSERLLRQLLTRCCLKISGHICRFLSRPVFIRQYSTGKVAHSRCSFPVDSLFFHGSLVDSPCRNRGVSGFVSLYPFLLCLQGNLRRLLASAATRTVFRAT